MDPHWVSAIAESITALGVGLALWSLRISRKDSKTTREALSQSVNALRADHDRAAREKAVDLIASYTRNVKQRGAAARKLAEKLDPPQSLKIINQEEMDLPKGLLDLIDSTLVGSAPKPTGEVIHLSVEQTSEIRWQMLSYLNSVEAVLSAWRHKVADQEMIVEEFRFLVSPDKNEYIMVNVRNAVGGKKSYPAIAKFVEYLATRDDDAEPIPPIDKNNAALAGAHD